MNYLDQFFYLSILQIFPKLYRNLLHHKRRQRHPIVLTRTIKRNNNNLKRKNVSIIFRSESKRGWNFNK